MNIYRALAVREIKKKKEFMNQDTSINNRPVADGVLPSPTTFLVPSKPRRTTLCMITHVHAHTCTHAAWLWLHECLSSRAVTHAHTHRRLNTDMRLHLPGPGPTASHLHMDTDM